MIADAVSPARERPIMFSAPMVRGILEDRKTKTRRVVKLSIPEDADEVFFWSGDDLRAAGFRNVAETGCWARKHGRDGYLRYIGPCPYGVPGDLLWVRESWSAADTPGGYAYMADHPGDPRGLGWRPSIHMPRRARRITLRITDVQVERLNEISEADAIAEGIATLHDGFGIADMGHDSSPIVQPTASQAFRFLWDRINGEPKPGKPDVSWAANPWVWVVTFERVTP